MNIRKKYSADIKKSAELRTINFSNGD